MNRVLERSDQPGGALFPQPFQVGKGGLRFLAYLRVGILQQAFYKRYCWQTREQIGLPMASS